MIKQLEQIKQNVTGGMNTGSNGNSGDSNNGGVSDFMKSIINNGNNNCMKMGIPCLFHNK